MGGFSIWHWLIVLAVVLILFGAGRLPQVAGDLARGIRSFKKGLQDEPSRDSDPAHPQEDAPPPKSPPAP